MRLKKKLKKFYQLFMITKVGRWSAYNFWASALLNFLKLQLLIIFFMLQFIKFFKLQFSINFFQAQLL